MEITETDFLFYSGSEGKTNIAIMADRDQETIWTSQKNISQIFNIDVRTVSEHFQNIFKTNELHENSVIRIIWITPTRAEKDYNFTLNI